ncbi:MAG: hypothetical protein HY291_04425 [Planctomycetes bacterium]|nr:hypothetical protein [Planctomycetota bacterium]
MRTYVTIFTATLAACGICISTAVAHAEQEEPKAWETKATLDWIIVGVIKMPGEEKLPTKDEISFKIVKKFPESPESKGSTQWWLGPTKLEFSLDGNGAFKIVPRKAIRENESKSMRGLELETQYKLLCMWKGRFTNIVTFEVTQDPFKLQDLTLTFSAPVEQVYRARILDPETGKGMPNVKVILQGWGGNDPKEKVGLWDFGECISDDGGLIRVEPVPDRPFTLREEHWGALLPLGPFGTPQYPRWFGALTKETADKLKPEEVPLVYYVPKGKGMIWRNEFHYLLEGGITKPVPPGTVLQFKGLSNERRKPWPAGEEPRFEITVDEKGGVKTPIVLAGKYAVCAKNGLFEKEHHIEEFSLPTGELKPTEEKQP